MKFILGLVLLSFFIFSIGYGKANKNSADILGDVMRGAHDSAWLPNYSDIVILIPKLKIEYSKVTAKYNLSINQEEEFVAEGFPSSTRKVSKNHKNSNVIDIAYSESTCEDVITVIKIYLNAFIVTSLIDQHGVFAGESTSSETFTNRQISMDFEQVARKVKENARTILLWAKDNYPLDFLEALKNTPLFNTLISDKEVVSDFADIKFGKFSILDQNTYFNENQYGLIILINAGFSREKEYLPCERPLENAAQIFNCFPTGSLFLKTLAKSEQNINYLFLKGSFNKETGHYIKPIVPNSDSCTFLGGYWSLDKINKNNIAIGSHVQILTPDGKTITLFADDLTRLFNQSAVHK